MHYCLSIHAKDNDRSTDDNPARPLRQPQTLLIHEHRCRASLRIQPSPL